MGKFVWQGSVPVTIAFVAIVVVIALPLAVLALLEVAEKPFVWLYRKWKQREYRPART